jgi:endonuclease YncB( thermonuclease family)
MRAGRLLRGIPSIALAASVAIALAGSAAGAESRKEHPTSCAGLAPGPTRTVARIIDGETLALDDGSEVRLIGVLAPRASDAYAEAGRWPPEIAAIAELEGLVLAKSVDLAFGGERADRYGRALAHVTWRDADRRHWLQGQMLEQGLARAYVQAGNRACAAELMEAERIARQARRGLWAEAAYAIRPAAGPLALSRRRSSFQVVEGHIERVGQGRGAIYLDFGVGHGAFSVSLRRADRALLGDSADNPKALEGKVVLVRGWIARRSGTFTGPVIDLSAGGLIEVLETAAEGRPSAPNVWARHRRSAGAWRYSGSQRPELGQDRHSRSRDRDREDRP